MERLRNLLRDLEPWPRTLSALSEDQSSHLSTLVGWFRVTGNLSSRGVRSSSGLRGSPYTCLYYSLTKLGKKMCRNFPSLLGWQDLELCFLFACFFSKPILRTAELRHPIETDWYGQPRGCSM